jgi:hypothetical protein
MKKNDLKTGMYVKTRNGKTWVIIVLENEPYLVYPSGYMDVENFPNICDDKDFDIIQVYKYSGNSSEHNNGAFLLQYDVYKNDILKPHLFSVIYPAEETIEIGGIKYSKLEVENKLKDLKPIK